MFHNEEIELFALEIQFEEAATAPELSAAERYRQMQTVLERMHLVVLSGFHVSPQLGEHLTELCLDYLAREDLAPSVVREAFARHSGGGVTDLHHRLLANDLRRTVTKIAAGSAPALSIAR